MGTAQYPYTHAPLHSQAHPSRADPLQWLNRPPPFNLVMSLVESFKCCVVLLQQHTSLSDLSPVRPAALYRVSDGGEWGAQQQDLSGGRPVVDELTHGISLPKMVASQQCPSFHTASNSLCHVNASNTGYTLPSLALLNGIGTTPTAQNLASPIQSHLIPS